MTSDEAFMAHRLEQLIAAYTDAVRNDIPANYNLQASGLLDEPPSEGDSFRLRELGEGEARQLLILAQIGHDVWAAREIEAATP